MNTRKNGAFLTAVIVLMLWNAGRIEACLCGGDGKVQPCQAYGNAKAVFVGVVTGVEEKERKPRQRNPENSRDAADEDDMFTPRVFSFAVEEAFGGVSGGEAKVATGRGAGDCGYHFVKGERYLVYAYSNRRGDGLATGICAPTKPAVNAAEELRFLRNLSLRAAGTTLSGAVILGHHLTEDAPPIDKRVVGLPITIEGEDVRREVLTDAEGRYQLIGLKAGTYTVRVTLPDDLFTYRAEKKVTVAERGCGNVSFGIADNGRISGSVIDADGQPVPEIVLELTRAEDAGAERPNYNFFSTDKEGKFIVQPLEPGSYIIGVRLNGMSFPDAVSNRYPRTFYPGVSDIAQATPITITRAGEHASGRMFHLPPRLTERTVEGVVVLADGRPAANASVGYQEILGREHTSDYGVQVDAQGRFTVKVHEGFAYLIGAHINTKDGKQMHAELIKINASAEIKPIKLVISEPNGNCERCNNLRSGKKRTLQ